MFFYCAMAIYIPFILFESIMFHLKSINHEFLLFDKSLNKQTIQGRVAWWLAACAQKPKVPGSSPASSYVQR